MLKYLKKISVKKIAILMLLALVCLGNSGMTAFEAHVIGVTAEIVNNTPSITPDMLCLPGTGEPTSITISTSLAGADLVYSIDGSNPDCDDETLFTHWPSPFSLGLVSAKTVKARACHADGQSAVISKYIDLEDCGGGAICGNGELEGNEQCDDGNQTDGDGCSALCEIEEEEPPICGNDIVEVGETCDDGNTDDGDGCSSTCQVETPTGLEMCMKINEVYYDPDDEHKKENQSENKFEWIELYNACDYTVNLKDWYLEDNYSQEIIHNNYPIDSHAFVVIAADASVWNTYWTEIPSNAFKIALGGNDMFGGLSNSGDVVKLYDSGGNLIDAVSWGDNTEAFNPSVPDVVEGHSISRVTMGVDTDTADDWMDTHGTSIPPGPNPGTNPHDENGNLILPNLVPPPPPEPDPEPVIEPDSDPVEEEVAPPADEQEDDEDSGDEQDDENNNSGDELNSNNNSNNSEINNNSSGEENDGEEEPASSADGQGSDDGGEENSGEQTQDNLET